MNRLTPGAKDRTKLNRSFRVLLLAACLVALCFGPAGAQDKQSGKAVSMQAMGFAESPTVLELPPFKGESKSRLREEEKEGEKNPENREIIRHVDPSVKPSADAALASEAAKKLPRRTQPRVLPAPSVSFEGISEPDTVALGQGYLPPDTNGEVGPNHFVQTVNVAFRIWDKSGAPLTNVASIADLFAPLGGPCASTTDGDPIVLYDQLADRWIISQFCVSVANPNNHQLIAVSKTGDPTGSYYLYDFMMPNNKFNDYPHFGVWPDAYYMTDNQFNQAGDTFQQAGVFAFDRAKMLAGDPTASYVYFDTAVLFPPSTGNTGPDGIGGMLPSDLDGFTPPPAGAPCPFAYFEAGEFGDPADQLRIFNFHADFATPANSTFTEETGSPLAVAAFDPVVVPDTRNVVPQPAPATSASYLDAINDRLMFRLAYRNFGSSESLVLNHTVNAAINPAYRAAVRFYQLNRATPASAFTIAEQQTFDGGGDTSHRWMGSGAMNFLGDFALGFSVSSTTVFPSIRYAAKLNTDPPGSGLAQGEQSIIAGAGSQTATGQAAGRWGDYSDITVDPTDDCSFWYTQEYYSTTSSAGWHTRIAKVTVGTQATSPRGTISGTITNCQSGLPIPNALVQIAGGYARGTQANGTYSATVVPGTYNASVTAPGYDTASAGGLVVTNGGTATFNACLTGTLKQPVADTASVIADNCNSNGVIDPNETVTVSFGIKNTGSLNTANLVATLQPTGGVTNPSAPQSYGVVVAGGATVSKSFTFTAGNIACGSNIIATLQLQDGATNLGTITYNFVAGNLISSNYATGDIAVAIPDNNPSGVDIPLTVSDVTTLTDVNVSFRLNHTYDSDLTISLVHPDNTVVTLVTGRGSSSANFGTGGNNCSAIPTTIDDQASTAISAGTAPFAGPFKPESPLSALNGKPSNGTWKLRIIDGAAQDTGTVGCFKLELNRHVVCCGALITAVPPAVLTAENFTPANSAPDPGEWVTVDLPLHNTGGSNTTSLTGTLQATGGVTNPSGPQDYGVVTSGGGTVTRSFNFIVSGNCGDLITLTLGLQDGVTNLGTITYQLRLGALSSGSLFSEALDGVTAPTLPAGWTTAATGGESAWVTSAANPSSAPNDAFAPDVGSVGNTELVTPTIAIPAGGGLLTFRNLFNMEASSSPTVGYDGMVLEISINGGAFADITSGGNAFTAGGYTRTISGGFNNPIANRTAWSGLSGGTAGAPTYITSTINLPAAAAGQNIKLKWRVGTDTSAIASGAPGVRVDGISITGSFPSCVSNQAPLIINGPPPSPVIVGTPYSYTFVASGNPAPVFSFTGVLPPGLGLSAAGVFSGTATSGGTGSFPNITVKASNAVLPDATQNFSLSTVTRVTNYIASFGLSGSDAVLSYDYDGDSFSNLMEYALGMDPTVATLAGAPSVILKDYSGTSYLSMTFQRSSLATDLTYIVQASSDLVGWSDLAMSSGGGVTSGLGFVSETGSAPSFTVEVRDTVPENPFTSPRRFMRLKITSP